MGLRARLAHNVRGLCEERERGEMKRSWEGGCEEPITWAVLTAAGAAWRDEKKNHHRSTNLTSISKINN